MYPLKNLQCGWGLGRSIQLYDKRINYLHALMGETEKELQQLHIYCNECFQEVLMPMLYFASTLYIRKTNIGSRKYQTSILHEK